MKKIFTFLILIILLFPVLVFAQSFDNPVPALNNQTVPTLAGDIIRAFLGIIGSLALVLFIYAGGIRLFSQGDSGKIKNSTDIMLWTGIGLVVIFTSYIILHFIFSII
jgi:uncharacterized membrane protein YidH (DUF202 family)